MFVSILIPTYKDLEALQLILDALQGQTYRNFEVVIAEDDDSSELKIFLHSYHSSYEIKHVFHENMGNRKAIIMNRAIKEAEGEYVICIDGDTIPFIDFVESHVILSKKNSVLCGRRVNLGDRVSQELRNKKRAAAEIEKQYFRLYSYLHNDNIRHYEQGFRFKAGSLLQKIMSRLDTNIHILASNFSCYKEALLKVNGFDEDLPYAPNRDDTDLEWRLIRAGYVMESCKYCANLLHLNHPRNDRSEEGEANMELIKKKKKKNEYVAKNGIRKL